MIVMFRGTQSSKNFAPQVLSLYATINAVKYSRKTLVLQFMQEFPVEKILRGQRDEEEDVINRDRYQFNDSGMDSLFRKVENQRLEKENFDLACRAMLKAENQLDIATVSAKKDFLKEAVHKKDYIAQILEHARDIYDDVYILGNGKHADLMQALNPLVDISIICIPQGSKEDVEEITTPKCEPDPEKPDEPVETNDYLFMVTEFDNRSSFDVAKLKKAYDVKRIALNPYNTGFKDAYNSGTMLAFAVSNTDVQPHDSNYELFNAVYDVHKQIMGNEVPDITQFDYTKLEKQSSEKEVIHDLRTLDASNVRYTKKYKRGLFRKKEVDGYEVTLDDFEDENDGTSSIDEIDEFEWETGSDGSYDDSADEFEEIDDDEFDEFEEVENDDDNYDDDEDFDEFGDDDGHPGDDEDYDEDFDEDFDEDDEYTSDDEDFDEDDDYEEYDADEFEEIDDDEEEDDWEEEVEEYRKPVKKKKAPQPDKRPAQRKTKTKPLEKPKKEVPKQKTEKRPVKKQEKLKTRPIKEERKVKSAKTGGKSRPVETAKKKPERRVRPEEPKKRRKIGR